MTIRKSNKFVALLLALLLAVGMLPVTAHAAGSMTLEVGKVTAELKAGEIVKVPITATANSGYGAGVLDVSWDKTALELTDVEYTALAPKGASAPIPTNNPGKYTIDFGNNLATENYTGTGVFFTLVFKITDTAAAGDHAISLSGFQIYDFDINELTVTSNPGKVTLNGGSGGAKAMTLEVGNVTAELKAGETVKVPITATANSGYGAGVLDVSWDKTALELTDVEYTALAPKGASAPIPTNNPGKYTIDFGNNLATENYTGTGEFFKLVFKITDTAAAGDHAISLSGFQIYDFDINELTVTSNPGKVTLTAASVKPTITTTTLPEGTVGTAYSATLEATGTTPITWSVSSGTLPAGLSLSGNTISGTPTTAGTANITVKAVNVAGEATKSLSIKINAASVKPTITTTTLPEGTVGTAYSATLEATGTTPITWSVSSGTLPAGLSLSGNTISGTPTAAESKTFTVKATNEAGEATKSLSITIKAAPVKPTITTPTLPSGKVGTAYNQTLTATGTTPITWTLEGGTMPTGLSLGTDGKISGTPSAAGTYNFTVKATNEDGNATKSFTITIASADATTYTATFNPGDGEGTEFTQTVTEGEKLTLPQCNFTAPAEGFEFARWNIGETGQPGEEVEIDDDEVITALWKKKMLTLTFNWNGGTPDSSVSSTENLPYGLSGFVLAPPSELVTPPAGKAFSGVKIDGKFYPVGSEYKVTKNVTVIFQWAEAEISEVSVTFPEPKAGGSISDYTPETVKVPAGANYDIYDFKVMDADGKPFAGTFEKGKKYSFVIYLRANEPFCFKGGMAFPSPETPAPPIKDRVKFKANGKDITENEKAPYPMDRIVAVYEFTIGSGGSGGSGGGGGGGSVSYAITAQKSENGTVELSKTRAAKGAKVTVTPQPDAGYETDKITVTDKDGKEVPVTKNSDGTYSFTMPSGQVTVASAFKKADGTAEPENPAEETPLLVVTINSMTYRLNGKTMTMDSAPFIDGNNRTMLPVRVIANALGITNDNIKWDSATKTASFTRADGKVVSCTVNSNVIKIGDEEVTIDTVPVIRNNRIYLPMRALFNVFNVPNENILWDATARTVTVTKKD